MDKKHTCKNGCIFCFIDQNPEGMRESLYFKDDDSRLSFIHGNYVTLTNMTDEDVARIVKMRFSPINISVHTTNPELRVKMMKNKRSGEVLRYLDTFAEAELSMCGQIVLCRGVNDGEELVRTMTDLSRLYPHMNSVSVVPAGLTRFRDGLYPLTDFTPEEAGAVIDTVNAFGDRMLAEHGERIFFAADELYQKANRPLPEGAYYEDYPQLDNGVGMLRFFEDEFNFAFSELDLIIPEMTLPREVSIATGTAAYPMLSRLAKRLEDAVGGLTIHVYRVENRFFGESVTVSGLLTGIDIRDALVGKPLGECLFLSENTQKADEDVFLCGMKRSELSEQLATPVATVENDGYAFLYRIVGLDPDLSC
jgi:putative radical SAM enzyme (TIGR03279 family)